MIKKIISTALLVLMLSSFSTYAALKTVTVNLPTFDVNLNGTKMDNTYSQYPILVYKDITYFPMTFFDCRFMRLETQWSQESGLNIEKTGVVAEYKEYKTDRKNAKTYQASIPTYKITVNGKVINNSKEEYPLLVFRDVTYFPLTWRFAVDEFNWQYTFDENEGLKISVNDIDVEKIELPNEVKSKDNVSVFDGYYYYVGEENGEGYVYRASVNNSQNASKIHKLPINRRHVKFFEIEDQLYFGYKFGSSNRASENIYYGFTEEGVAKELISGFSDFRFYKEDIISILYTGPASAHNLYYTETETGITRKIGNPDFVYKHLEVKDKWVYTSGYNGDYPTDKDAKGIYKINIETNEMIKLCDNYPYMDLTIVENDIYYINAEDKKLYKISLSDDKEKIVVDTAVNAHYGILNDDIHYISNRNGKLYKQGSDGTVQAILPEIEFSQVKAEENYLICFTNAKVNNLNQIPYGLVVLNGDGNTVFKTSDWIVQANIVENVLYYKTYETENSYKVHLY